MEDKKKYRIYAEVDEHTYATFLKIKDRTRLSKKEVLRQMIEHEYKALNGVPNAYGRK